MRLEVLLAKAFAESWYVFAEALQEADVLGVVLTQRGSRQHPQQACTSGQCIICSGLDPLSYPEWPHR